MIWKPVFAISCVNRAVLFKEGLEKKFFTFKHVEVRSSQCEIENSLSCKFLKIESRITGGGIAGASEILTKCCYLQYVANNCFLRS